MVSGRRAGKVVRRLDYARKVSGGIGSRVSGFSTGGSITRTFFRFGPDSVCLRLPVSAALAEKAATSNDASVD
jgi:hypothetical protein